MHLALADIDAGDLRVEVAPILFGQADIVGDEAQQILIDDAVAHQTHRRNPQPSWWISVRLRDKVAGTAPPTSVLWM